MWQPWRLTTLWASTACYRDSCNFLRFKHLSIAQITYCQMIKWLENNELERWKKAIVRRTEKKYKKTHRLMGGIYEVCCWYGLRCHDICIKFHKDWFRRSYVNAGAGRAFIDTQHGNCISLLQKTRLEMGCTEFLCIKGGNQTWQFDIHRDQWVTYSVTESNLKTNLPLRRTMQTSLTSTQGVWIHIW
jgi:hypothetical protein